MTRNKVVARFRDGQVIKGFTEDFFPAKPFFHVTPVGASEHSQGIEVDTAALKALFFVKDLATPAHTGPHRQEFDPTKPVAGRKIRVVFKDQEVLVGTTQGYDPKRSGFFVIPADTASNNERVFVIATATRQVSFL